jgi:hypothetical protein
LSLPSLIPGTAVTYHLCMKSCEVDADCGRPGLLACDQGFKVCTDFQGETLSFIGTRGGAGANGGACATATPPSRSALFSANVDASDPAAFHAAEASVAIDPTGSPLWIAYNKEGASQRPGGSEIGRSDDGGATWLPLAVPDAENLGDPALAVDPRSGTLYYAYIAGTGSCTPGNSFYGGNAIHVIHTRPGGALSTPATANSGTYATQDGLFMDKPQALVAPDGTLYVSFDAAPVDVAATVPSDIVVARSTDGGLTFTDVRASDGNRQAGRDLAQLAVAGASAGTGAAGDLWVSWQEPAVVGGIPPARFGHLWATRSSDHGQSFAPSVEVDPTDSAAFWPHALVASPDGQAVYVAYQTWTGAVDVFDVAVAVSIDSGQTFAPPVKANDDATCATHWLPALALGPTGHVWAVWYDNRFGDERVMGAEGMLSGSTLAFSSNFQVSDGAGPFFTGRGGPTITDYLGFVSLPNGRALAAWADLRNVTPAQDAQIFTAVADLPR